MNEPQLLLLRAGKTNVVALAIPSPPQSAMFVATTVTQKKRQDYLDEQVDLRFLFEYASKRTGYGFNLLKMKNKKIVMEPWDGPFSEDVLPGPRFFASNHTEEDENETENAEDKEKILVDGEWDMPDFGTFYSRYADVYYFASSVSEYEDDETPKDLKVSIESAYREKAFRGGFSYVHFYNSLAANRGRRQRLGIDEMQYASPGFINISGERDAFVEVRKLITDFLKNRKSAKEKYDGLYKFLSDADLLMLSGDDYKRPKSVSDIILRSTSSLSEEIGIMNTEAILKLVNDNPLVFAKVILSFYRRLEEAAKYVAQGRVNFS
ncbi:hypothetical protein MKK70_05855 [Methylobacterium sp. E-041]|nr:hypothetical protein [Methylobacterium sp. E-041]